MDKTSEENKNGMNRRDFLKRAGYSALGGVVVATAIPKSVKAALTPNTLCWEIIVSRSGLLEESTKGLYT